MCYRYTVTLDLYVELGKGMQLAKYILNDIPHVAGCKVASSPSVSFFLVGEEQVCNVSALYSLWELHALSLLHELTSPWLHNAHNYTTMSSMHH